MYRPIIEDVLRRAHEVFPCGKRRHAFIWNPDNEELELLLWINGGETAQTIFFSEGEWEIHDKGPWIINEIKAKLDAQANQTE